jgi:hypothetical protein
VAGVTQPLTSSPIMDCWWIVRTNAYWTASHIGLHLPKQPIRGSPVSKSSVPVHQSTASSPTFRTSLAPLELNARYATTPCTTPGPPVACRPRRLAPDRLTIAKAEFDMLRDGTARRSECSWSSALHIVPKKDNGSMSGHGCDRQDSDLEWYERSALYLFGHHVNITSLDHVAVTNFVGVVSWWM